MWYLSLSKFLELFVYNPKQPLIFSSAFFLFTFTVFMIIYGLIYRHHKLKIIFVTLFSLYFYYKSSGAYFVLLISCTIIDYNLAHLIAKSANIKRRKLFLILSLIANLGVLIYFKYTNFFYQLFCDSCAIEYTSFDIFLPVGVSFFTFQSLSYTIDIYRGNIKPVNHILDYAFYLSFFPQLVAGPIVRAVDFIPQINKKVIVTKEILGRGIFLIAGGLFKKAVIADYISANFVDRIFETPLLYSGLENLVGVYGYALQIYCDFSGYSDMAIGIALLMGFHFNINFDSPYQSKNITEFWRRWHISLSSWLKDYLYISLGGNRKGKVITYVNLFITMLLGGLWHGAALRFILWGAMHGMALVIHKFFLSFTLKPSAGFGKFTWLSKLTGVFITFNFVCFCWIFFRAENMEIAGNLLSQIFTNFNPSIFVEFVIGYKTVMIIMLVGYVLHFLPKSSENFVENWVTQRHWTIQTAILLVVVLILIQFKSAEIQPFIYFQF